MARLPVLALALLVGVARAHAGEALAPLATIEVTAAAASPAYVAEGVVEAVRQSAIAAQVPGRIVQMRVRAGDIVKQGQVLVRLDARAAADQLASSQAQVAAAQAQLESARREFDRNRRLYEKRYISQAAMEQAETQFKAAEAQARATLAQAGVASTQSTYAILTAPFGGIVASVAAEIGDLASPGVPLLTLYDPAQMRVVAPLPEGHVPLLAPGKPVTLLVAAGGHTRPVEATALTVLPTANPSTHTRDVRLELPLGDKDLAPGMFVRASFPLSGAGSATLRIPTSAVVRRPEFTAVYVVDAAGRAQLRQVRLGRTAGDLVEVASGLAAGERIAVDATAAARR